MENFETDSATRGANGLGHEGDTFLIVTAVAVALLVDLVVFALMAKL